MFMSREINRGNLLLWQGRRKPQRFALLAGMALVVCGGQLAYAIDFCAGATLTCNGHSASVHCCLTLAFNDPDGETVEVYTIPQGCTLFKTGIFKRINFPWFVTTPQLSQDSYFSQQAREAGLKLWCDTSVRCRHVDRDSGETFF